MTITGVDRWPGPPTGAGGPVVVPTPHDLFGPLLAEVQCRRLFEDGKSVVDAIPRRAADLILRDLAAVPHTDHALRAFFLQNFARPGGAGASIVPGRHTPLRQHIRDLWPLMIRPADAAGDAGSLLPLDRPYAVPGGRFRECYYWDSYFTMLGLIRDGHDPIARGMIDNFTAAIERWGHIPNGMRSYYLGRSQPPFYWAMLALVPPADAADAARRLAAMIREHDFWMAGHRPLRPGESAAHAVRLADGSLLNRYWDVRSTPRDESHAEDVATAAASDRPPVLVWRDLRAGAESGWDFSSRWLGAAGTLPSIRTTAILPVDLNALLHGLERAIETAARQLGDEGTASNYEQRAAARRQAMARHLWSDALGAFVDFDLDRAAPVDRLTAAALTPLFTGTATQAQAVSTAAVVADRLLARGGLRTTLVETGEQWDSPNGWAPLHWIATEGLRGYGQHALADEIARNWVAMVERVYRATGNLFEKYDVESAGIGGGGEYALQVGFGWTNAVTAAFIDRATP